MLAIFPEGAEVPRNLIVAIALLALVACSEDATEPSASAIPTPTPAGDVVEPASTPERATSIPTPILHTPPSGTAMSEPTTPVPELAITMTPTGTPAMSEPVEEPPQPDLKAIYAQAGDQLREREMIYHATITHTLDAGLYSQAGIVDVWVDASRNLARLEMGIEFVESPEPVTMDVIQIVTKNLTYSVYLSPNPRTDTTPANTCNGADEAIGVVLGCPGFTEESTTTIERGEYDGRPAVVLVTSGSWYASDERATFTDRLYLDPDTFLPLAKETEGTLDYGTSVPMTGLNTFEKEFIPHDAVPADFFDPVALAGEQLDAAPQPDFTVYWLGTTFEPGNGLPELVLDSAGVPDIPDAPYDLLLSYRLADVRLSVHGTPTWEIAMQEWSSAAWHTEWDATIRDHWQGHPCYEQAEIQLSGGVATVFMGYGNGMAPPDPSYKFATPPATTCGTTPYTRYEVIVDLGDTVLFMFTTRDSPYASIEALEAVLQGLVARESASR